MISHFFQIPNYCHFYFKNSNTKFPLLLQQSITINKSYSQTINNNVIISENKWTKVVAASTHQTASASEAASEQQQPRPLQQTHIEAVKAADVVLDCSNDQIVKCHIFTCRIHGGLRANESAVVRLRSRVWNSTLVEEFGHAASTVAIHAKAHLGSDFVKNNSLNSHNDCF